MNNPFAPNTLLMPPPFSDGLAVWSSQNGGPGSTTYASSNNAQVLFTDADFEECLEIVTNKSPQKLRYMGQTPMKPGCYLRVMARVKVVSGAMPGFEIAAWPADAGGNFVTGVTEKGPQVAATTYDKVYEVSAVFGSGERPGVDCVWGLTPVYGHFGLNVTGGANGSSVRIESIRIEDVTTAYLRDMMDWVDVRDYGARGDGVFNNRTAFEAADAAANGRQVLVPAGDYFISGAITLASEFRFEGRIIQAATSAFNLLAGLRYSNYLAAFKDEQLALEKALLSLLNGSDHDSLDLEGRDVNLTRPVDVSAAAGNLGSSNQRLVIRNGRLIADTGGTWPRGSVTANANYVSGQTILTNVSNAANIQPGSRITGNGVGREVYVTSVNVSASTVTMSSPLFGASSTQTYTFTRFSYLLDFSGFNFLSNFEIVGLALDGSSVASGVLLPPTGFNLRIYDTWFIRPRDRAITSHGSGDFAMTIEHCEFVSREENIPNSSRNTIAFNCNANDQRIRHNRGSRFRHFCVLGGNNTMFHGNHIYQGLEGDSTRLAGVILTQHKVNSAFNGNYIDNCWIEWTGEHAVANTANSVFGSLTLDGNLFFASNANPSFRFIQMVPYAENQGLVDLTVSDNTFRVSGGNIDRVDTIQTTRGTLDPGKYKNINFVGNVHDGVSVQTLNPALVKFTKDSASPNAEWTIAAAANLPFGGFARGVDAVVPTARIRTGANATNFSMPWVETEQGAARTSVQLNWSQAVIGAIALTVRCDTID